MAAFYAEALRPTRTCRHACWWATPSKELLPLKQLVNSGDGRQGRDGDIIGFSGLSIRLRTPCSCVAAIASVLGAWTRSENGIDRFCRLARVS